MYDYKEQLQNLKGKTIAIVYIFEGEKAKGFEHYHVWRSKIISRWLNAVEDLGCLPFILDVRSFVNKAMNNTLPHIDYVLNLNCGSKQLSSMSLIPSVCSFLSIPCIPCNSSTILMGENKKASNMIAIANNLNVPRNLTFPDDNAIFRPLNFGSSFGVRKGKRNDIKSDELYQEFIPGYDATFPIMYNPIKHDLDFLPGVLYFPNNNDPNWFFGENEKITKDDYENYPLYKIDKEAKEKLLQFAKSFPIDTFCRIDVRIKCANKLSKSICDQYIKFEDIYFVEINPMPTVKLGNAYDLAFEYINNESNFYQCLQIHKEVFGSVNTNNFLLSSSMIALSNEN